MYALQHIEYSMHAIYTMTLTLCVWVGVFWLHTSDQNGNIVLIRYLLQQKARRTTTCEDGHDDNDKLVVYLEKACCSMAPMNMQLFTLEFVIAVVLIHSAVWFSLDSTCYEREREIICIVCDNPITPLYINLACLESL